MTFGTKSTADELILAFFENLQLSFLDEFDKEIAQPGITLKKRSSRLQILTFHEDPEEKVLSMGMDGSERLMTYSWPGKTPYEAWKFTCILRVLALISEAIQKDLLITKRSIYYDDPGLFGTQSVVNTVVDDIAFTIGVDRAALHVISVGKGLAVGAVRIRTKAGNLLDLSAEDALIPRLRDINTIDVSEVRWVCVIEKEAVFRRLVHNKYYINSIAGKGILITGKGYPDLSTREFIHLISDISIKKCSSTVCDLTTVPPPTPPLFFALVDGDCDGIAIMSTYKYGSKAHAHASASLNAPRLEWLGIRIRDVVVEQARNAEVDEDEDWVTIALSERDVKKIQSMLANNPVFDEKGPELEWRAELQTMMMLNVKVETEALYGKDGGLEDWIDGKMNVLFE